MKDGLVVKNKNGLYFIDLSVFRKELIGIFIFNFHLY
jgi:hypothetical protein